MQLALQPGQAALPLAGVRGMQLPFKKTGLESLPPVPAASTVLSPWKHLDEGGLGVRGTWQGREDAVT